MQSCGRRKKIGLVDDDLDGAGPLVGLVLGSDGGTKDMRWGILLDKVYRGTILGRIGKRELQASKFDVEMIGIYVKVGTFRCFGDFVLNLLEEVAKIV